MADRRKKVDKYTRLKPKVSPVTYIAIGVFVLIVILTLVLMIDGPKEKLFKEYNRSYTGEYQYFDKNHNIKKVSLSSLEKILEKDEEVVVYIGSPICPHCLKFIDNVQGSFLGDLPMLKQGLNDYVDQIYYVQLDYSETGFSLKGLNEFYEKYELTGANSIPDFISFKNGEVVFQYKFEEVIQNPDEDDTINQQNILRSINKFVNNTVEGFNK